MVTRIKFLQDTIISYGPQRVLLGQVVDVENDSVALSLIAQGLAVLDASDPINADEMIDGGLGLPGDPGGELEQESQIG